jgi:hypothetical protein
MSWTSDVAASIRGLDTSPRRLRSFALTVGGVLLSLSLWMLFRHRAPGFRWVAGVAGLLLLAAGAAAPSRLGPLYRGWMAVAFAMGWFMSRLLLVAIFVLVVTPIAWVGRLAGQRFLEVRPDSRATSYWVRRDPDRRDDYRKMY